MGCRRIQYSVVWIKVPNHLEGVPGKKKKKNIFFWFKRTLLTGFRWNIWNNLQWNERRWTSLYSLNSFRKHYSPLRRSLFLCHESYGSDVRLLRTDGSPARNLSQTIQWRKFVLPFCQRWASHINLLVKALMLIFVFAAKTWTIFSYTEIILRWQWLGKTIWF